MIAAAYGPAEVRSSKELIDKATLEVVFRPKVGSPGTPKQYDHSYIMVTFEVLTNLGSKYPRF